MPPPKKVGASAKSSLPINNPSYATRPEMWHAIAMQQERLASLGLPGAARRPAQRSGSRGAGSSGTQSSTAASIRGHAVAATALAAPTGAAAVARARSSAAAAAQDDDSDGEGGASRRAPLSLAQRMGLVEAPAAPLAAEEWELIAERSRQISGSGCGAACTICLQAFRGENQVLLSCSHVFHTDCLRSWEQYSRSRCCPVCRKQHYKKRAHFEGGLVFAFFELLKSYTHTTTLSTERTNSAGAEAPGG